MKKRSSQRRDRHDEEDSLRIALVCDWLTTPGGAEKVLLELHHMYPQAPIYTSQYRRKGIDWFNDADVRMGWLQIFPAALRKFLGPLRQLYFQRLDLSDYDLVISVTGAEAKAIRTKTQNDTKAAKHLCYCHVPTQYYWQLYDKYIENPGFGILNPVVRFFFQLLVKPLRRADYASAQRPDRFITISNYAKAQIKKYYDRDAIVITPPVETGKFSKRSAQPQKKLLHSFSTFRISFPTSIPQNNNKKSTKNEGFSTRKHEKSTSFPQVFHNQENTIPQYYIIACRQVTWKRVDLAIEACKRAKLPLLVVGDGSEHNRLTKLADGSPYIQFLPWVSTEDLAIYLQNAKGYIFPSLEPFGIAAVEALSAGCPVIAYAEGGSRDFIEPPQNGILFQHQEVEDLAKALKEFEKISFDRAKVIASAQRFDMVEFRHKIKQAVAEIVHSSSGESANDDDETIKSQKAKGRQ